MEPDGGSCEEKKAYGSIVGSLCCAVEIDGTLKINYNLKIKKKNRSRLTDIENRFVVAKRGEGVGREMDWESGLRCKLLNSEWVGNEVLPYSTGNYIQSLGIDHDGT